MKVPLPWLREYCDPALDTAGIEERLTMTGTKVEAVHRVGVPDPDRFVVGHVLSVERHPNADRLSVCKVDLGDGGEPATIVCGAPNVGEAETVAVARPGAVLPGGRRLEEVKLRGVVSEGMILAADELELDAGPAARDGIMVLDDLTPDAEFAAGTPLAEVLPIATDVLELEITPNRPDCLAVYGIARELHAATRTELADAPWAQDPGQAGPVRSASVTVEAPDLCPRFTARVFEDVTVGPSPLWLATRLHAAGQRPINNVVDITNYAMLVSGQPLHAFDLDRIAGASLTVRRALPGETLRTLDGQDRKLDEDMVVIEDEDGPTSIAGIMGGERSEVHEATTRVLMEAATWSGPAIHHASWALGLRSEASSRFEKGLQPEQCMYGQAIAARLMEELCGATLLPGTIDVGGEPPPPARINLRERRVRRILGVDVPRARQAQILHALDFATEPVSDGLRVTVAPLRRADVTREVDLIEEVARIDGLERLPATLPPRRGAAGLLTHAQLLRREAEDLLAGLGLYEIAGWSFADPGLLDRLRLSPDDPLRQVVELENPLSEDQSIMRPTLLGSLLDVARHNVARNGPDVAIFESGAVYRAVDGRVRPGEGEHHALGALLTGVLTPPSWRAQPREADFFAAKALLEALAERFHIELAVIPARWPFLHPGRAADVLAPGAERPLGFIGEVHPLVAASWDLDRTAVFSIDLGRLAALVPEVQPFRSFGAFPPLRQDIAVTVPVGVPAERLIELVRGAAGALLESVRIFDVYSGEQVGEGRRSLALALSFRAPDRTLTDEDVEPLRVAIVGAVAQIGGELRG